MIFLYSSELHLSHAGLVYILADFGANLLIWVVISTSQIDYILFKGKTLNLQPSVSIMPFDAINTSDHTLIKVEITTQISKLAPKSAKISIDPSCLCIHNLLP
jgi:hypothetical protein